MATSIDDLNKSVAAYNKYTLDKGKYDAIFNSLIQKRVRYHISCPTHSHTGSYRLLRMSKD